MLATAGQVNDTYESDGVIQEVRFICEISVQFWPLTFNRIHAKHGAMQKMQILFPDPLMGRLRTVAAEEDRPVSEVIRRAVEKFLEMKSEKSRPARGLPTFRGGKILVSAENLKEVLYNDESL